jgi:hypothetical protein
MAPTLSEPQWFCSFFVGLWLSVGAILSFVGGWHRLAGRFPVSSSAAVQGRRFRFVSGAVGLGLLPVSYRSCLFCMVSSVGLELSVFPIFRFMHPPMFIPWSAVEEATRERWWFISVATLRLRGFSQQVRLVGKAGAAALEAYECYRDASA